MSGSQLVAAIAVVILVTAVLPPAAAWSLNEARIAQTQERARAASERLRARADELAAIGTTVGIACGPGRLPDIVPAMATARAAAAARPSHQAWLFGATIAPGLFGGGMPTDAWGHCFLLNVGDWASDGPVWILSTGPNGLVDTPTNASAIGGDDVGARVR